MTDISLLPLEIRDLPNGSQLYHIRNQSKLTRIQAVMRTGSIHETVDAGCGLSHFLEHMLFQGCQRYPGSSAAEKIHSLGGDCNAYTTFDHTAYYVEVPVGKFAEAADVITSMFTEPLFPEEKFRSEKEVIAREADMIADRPVHRLIQQLWRGLFPGHPASMPIIGFSDKIADVTRERMVDYYMRRYGAMRSHWLVTGDLDTDMVQQLLADKLSGFARGNLDEIVLPPLAEPLFEEKHVQTFADPLCRIALGIRAPHPRSAVTPALDILAGIIGGNDSSYLVRKLLYQQETALSIDAEFDTTSFAGIMAVTAAAEPDKAADLERGIADELARIRKEGVTAEDLQQEKLQQKITLYQQLKNSSSALGIVNTLRMNFGRPDGLDWYLKQLDAVTLDDVNAAAQEYLDPRNFVWSKVEPEKTKSVHSVEQKAQFTDRVNTGVAGDGLKYVLLERSHIPMDSMALLLPAGPVWEDGELPRGISQLMTKWLATGPDDISEEDFYAFMDARGIDLDVSCGVNTVQIEFSFPPEARQDVMDILCRLVRNPRRDVQIFERVRKNLIEQLQSKLMAPNFAAMICAKRRLFGSHVGGNSRLESVEYLEQISVDSLLDFYYSRFAADLVNAASTVAPGVLDAPESVIADLEKLSAAVPWCKNKLALPQPAAASDLAANGSREPYIVDLPREQSAVICVVPGVFAHSREFYALLIADAALNGLASNLFNEVREKRSLAYSTGAVVTCGLVQGIIALHAGVKMENAAAALNCLQQEIDRLGTCGLEKAEFEAARLSALSSLARQMESPDARLMHAQLGLFYGEDPQKSLQCCTILSDISFEECNIILSKVFQDAPMACVIAGAVNNKS